MAFAGESSYQPVLHAVMEVCDGADLKITTRIE